MTTLVPFHANHFFLSIQMDEKTFP